MKLANICTLLVISATAFLIAGCTVKYGGMVPKSQFIYPNSNVIPLGPVKHSVSKTAFFVSPKWTMEDTKKAYNDALAKVPEATALINYKEDTSFTSVMLFNTITYTLEGTAVKATVGKQAAQ